MGIRVIAVFNRNFATLVIDKKLLSKHFFLLTDQNHQLDIFLYKVSFLSQNHSH